MLRLDRTDTDGRVNTRWAALRATPRRRFCRATRDRRQRPRAPSALAACCVIASVALAAAGCGAARVARVDGAALDVLIATAPASLDPRYTTDAAGVRVSRLLHAGLIGLDPVTLFPYPYAAENARDEGERGMVFTLREGVRFASGAPLEAEDVCATLEALADPAMASPHRALAASIASCRAEGARGVRVTLGQARATLATDMEMPILRRDQARAPHSPFVALDGLGPYRLVHADDREILLEAREGGVLTRPSHDVAIRVVHDENARALRVLAGHGDVVPNGFSPPLLEALAAQGATVSSTPGANLTYLVPDHERGPLADLRVRRAVSLALDRDRLVRTLFAGRARAAASVLPPDNWAAPKGIEPLAYDPDLAARLFAEAGVRHLSLIVSTERARGLLARAMAQMIGDAGVEVEVTSLELGVLLQRLGAGDYELALLQMPEITEPNILRLFFHSDAIPHNGVGANRARYVNPLVDRDLELASRDRSAGRRAALYDAITRQLRDDVAVVPLFHEDQVAVTSRRASGYRPSAEGRWTGLAAVP